MYSPISLDYFLNMEVATGGGGKEILNLNGKLKYVKDIIQYWSSTPTTPKLTSDNSQYYNCMMAGFRKGVENHHDIGWDALTDKYYDSLELMSDEEIESYLEETPAEFDNGFIKHSYHRAYAMIGRLVRGEKYIPFYMETEKIYDIPWKVDGKLRTTKLTSKINLLSQLDEMGIDRNEYCICQSGLLTAMGIRVNDDIDIIISSKLRNTVPKWPSGVDIFPPNASKFDYFGASGDDDILTNYCIEIDGYKFLEPRFYFARKNMDSVREMRDWNGVSDFFCKESHKGYPFNFEFYKWGLPNMADRVSIDNLDLDSMEVVIDKYNRTIDGINHGRAVYKGDGYYVKVFHPDYCRLSNLKEALDSGFLNGLTPALTHLINDSDGNLCGYIMLSGTHPTELPTQLLTDVLRNSSKRKKVYYDFVSSNIITDNYYNQLSLIDLESVYDLSKLDDMKIHNAKMKPADMLDKIKNI